MEVIESFSRRREELEVLPITIDPELEPELADFSSDIVSNNGKATTNTNSTKTNNPPVN